MDADLIDPELDSILEDFELEVDFADPLQNGDRARLAESLGRAACWMAVGRACRMRR
jgi:hypothetical protein